LYGRWNDKDLGGGGFGQCYTSTTASLGTDEMGQPLPCRGQKIDAGAIVTLEPWRRFTVTAEYLHRLVDDPMYPTSFLQESHGWLALSYFPTPALHLYARSRLAIYDLRDASHAERSLWTYAEVSYRMKSLSILARYDNRFFFDVRDSTLARSPNPENWL